MLTYNKTYKKIFNAIAAGLILIAFSGCLDTQKSKDTKLPAPGIATPAGMAQYLINLPPVKSVQTWQNPYAPGITITTEHYKIHTTLLEPLMLRQVPGFIESAYKAYQNQLPSPIESKSKFIVYLFATRSQWEEFTKVFSL